ncbi:unnamed protein product, partial [Rotaria sp. Silwood2]
SNDSSNRLHRESPRQTVPPFRIILQDVNQYPATESGVIKEINKRCKSKLTYGRYTKSSKNQMCFLFYTSTVDHNAVQCSNKDNPICLRCAQHHLYNPNCNNFIKCAHFQGDHISGNLSCPLNSEKRQEKNQRLKILRGTFTLIAQQQHK